MQFGIMIRLGFGATETWVGILGCVSLRMLLDISEPISCFVKMGFTSVSKKLERPTKEYKEGM